MSAVYLEIKTDIVGVSVGGRGGGEGPGGGGGVGRGGMRLEAYCRSTDSRWLTGLLFQKFDF